MDKVPPKQRNHRGASREVLLELSKTELVERIIQLEAHNFQLKNIINRNLSNSSGSNTSPTRKKPFDFAKCHFRRVLLHIMYFGWDYQGLAVQEDSTQTIEHHLFHALIKSCLIQSRETSQYHRCGRTDKGVSAFGQVISISLRSKFTREQQNLEDSLSDEIPYCKLLNRLLPKEIRAVAWMPIPEDKQDYSARFDCTRRQYKYYFPRSSLNVSAMRDACARIVGSHDFRHLCKMDVGNGVTEFTRRIFSTDVVAVGEETCDPTSMYCLIIEGNAFLWHQIRCIMGVLLLIGQGNEEPDVITQLLDVDKVLRKPQYSMALDIPLNLFHCTYELEKSVDWVYDREELRCVISHIQGEWTLQSVKAIMIKDSLNELEAQYAKISDTSEIQNSNNSKSDRVAAHSDCLLQGVKARVYTPILKRETCSSLEERIEYYRKKRKTVQPNEELDT